MIKASMCYKKARVRNLYPVATYCNIYRLTAYYVFFVLYQPNSVVN